MELNKNIKLFPKRTYNTKASEEYVHVIFDYPDANFKWDGWVPVEYRRTGVSIPASDKTALFEHLNNVYYSVPKRLCRPGGPDSQAG